MDWFWKVALVALSSRSNVLARPSGAVAKSRLTHPPFRSLSLSSKRTCYRIQFEQCPGDCYEEFGEEKCDDTVANCDVTGWHCSDTQTSLHCNCQLFGSQYVCEGSDAETCEYGSPPCLYGRCKSMNEACGSVWSLDPTSQTCESLFGSEEPLTKLKCEAVFGNRSSPICPASVFGSEFRSWANIMNDGAKVAKRLRAAALDTMVFYDTLRGMMVGEIPLRLETTDISMHFDSFREFSCLRNVPECAEDRPATAACETSCDTVTDAMHTWLARCWDAARSTQALNCSGFGQRRDCDGTWAAADSSDLPGLCETFQNEPMFKPQAAVDRTISQLSNPWLRLAFIFLLQLKVF